jgi:PiT family inorganic phosphate transporter
MVTVNLYLLLGIVILTAFIFTLTNGLNDASSVVATFITSGAATPAQAIVLASFFGLLGAVIGGSAVANTVSKIVSLPSNPFVLKILLSSMIGAITWNLITWHFGLPSSSTHALVGGLVGSVWISSGANHILWGWNELFSTTPHLVGIMKIIAGLIISPLAGFVIAYLLQIISKIILRNARYELNKTLNKLQWVISSLLAYSHGANDAQKVIGIITLAITCINHISFSTPPLWVRISSGLIMFLGTMFGGWSIMKTLGMEIFTIRPIHSLNSQLSSGGSIIFATMLGAPVSTTHVVVGSVMGVGAGDEYKLVNWGIAKEILAAWLITIPSSALLSAAIFALVNVVI